MMRVTTLRLRLGQLLLLAGVSVAATLHAQDPRDALISRAFNEFDPQRRLQLLVSALNPTAGPPRGAWPVGVQLLAQTLVENGQDSLAGMWLRWAVRLAPDLQPDTVQFLPKVVAAYRSARDFVLRTRTPADSAVPTAWLWPAPGTAERAGRLQVSTTGLTAPVRMVVKGVGPVGPGGSLSLDPGSYEIIASMAGYDTLRVTREVLPGATTVVAFRLQSALARVAPPRVAPQQPIAVQRHKGGIPWWVKVGAGAGVVWAILWNAWIKHAHL